ncbi:hypothetical protein N8370_07905 [Amylibacter sp.]|nr:hypothetical protein [Amylibacter sp.]
MEIKDKANLGLSASMHMKLQELSDADWFIDMKDAYRLAASLAMKKKLNVSDRNLTDYKNMYDVGGVDEDFIFKNAISIIYPDEIGKEYRYLEKLADAGMEFLSKHYDETGGLDIVNILSNET